MEPWKTEKLEIMEIRKLSENPFKPSMFLAQY
jgi:hypothetical protein